MSSEKTTFLLCQEAFHDHRKVYEDNWYLVFSSEEILLGTLWDERWNGGRNERGRQKGGFFFSEHHLEYSKTLGVDFLGFGKVPQKNFLG